ncbi:unnamed protein product [Phytophthora fragariaefolia]|uniref:Unnamed protein product n=1 Tax=Phytophthora fragariaefolia TaxID=1490495 RepID=A0A9W6WSH0_9STRA|nr:unnamed protein product [Phytophthora fragariaefolia]
MKVLEIVISKQTAPSSLGPPIKSSSLVVSLTVVARTVVVYEYVVLVGGLVLVGRREGRTARRAIMATSASRASEIHENDEANYVIVGGTGDDTRGRGGRGLAAVTIIPHPHGQGSVTPTGTPATITTPSRTSPILLQDIYVD